MHLSQRAHILIVATALLGIAGLWSQEPALAHLWCGPAALLLVGLGWEALVQRRVTLSADLETAARAALGRAQAGAFAFRNLGSRRLRIEFAPVTPAGVEPLGATRFIVVPPAGRVVEPFMLMPVRLGPQRWPPLPVRCLGAAGLAWWGRELAIAQLFHIAPATRLLPRARPRGDRIGLRARRAHGAGSELYQLRAYTRGDPLARIDWKATARTGALVTREFNEDQHLDILIAVDAGRLSRVRAGRLDRLGLYANIAARFALLATPNDDRVGLVVFAERPLAVCAPQRGVRAIARVHDVLARMDAQAAESEPVNAALRIRALLKHRSLVIVLTDLDDSAAAEPLARAVRLLAPPHLVVVAGVESSEIHDLASAPARSRRDPWVGLAALEHERRIAAVRLQLQRLGTPVIAAPESSLQERVFAEYERLRRRRRI
jgi:uncharacterized protein (DUF58 family)